MQQFDYVIVGAGSAGCVIANRISANPLLSVLLIEAGPPDDSAFIKIPKGSVKLFGDDRYVWQYPIERSVPHIEPGQNKWVRGRTLGGSSSVNGMMYVRGQPEDYDRWEALGNAGWGWREMGRCFRALEDHELGDDGVRGTGGPLFVSSRPRTYPLCDAFIEAGAALGLPRRDDLNRPDQEGVGYYPMTIKRGWRVSAAGAFLEPVKDRKNLTIVTGAMVSRVLFEKAAAIGVECRKSSGEMIRYLAAREVIVAAGAIESPKLLQLSGIGPAPLLGRFGIPLVKDLPGVGMNLREHPVQAMQFRLKGRGGHNAWLRGPGLLFTLLQYALFRNNMIATCGYEAGVFARSRPELSRPDIQLHFSPFSLQHIDGRNYLPERDPGVQCIGNPMRVESQGRISIRSADASAPPKIEPNFLGAAADRRVFADMIAYMRRLFADPHLAEHIVTETIPGKQVAAEEDLVNFFHKNGQSGFHAVGTCKMGQDSDAVVDARLRVRGVTGLRVADCSVMPEIVSGNTNGPAMALGWRAAELIIEDTVATRERDLIMAT